MTSSLLKQVERLRYLTILLLSLCAFANASAEEAATSDEINEKVLSQSAIKPTWTNDADNPWYLYKYGSDYDADGNYVPKYRLETPSLSLDTSSTISMTYSSEYDTALYFEGEVSSYEESNMKVLVDGEEKALITDNERTRVFIRIPSGTHSVEFIATYRYSELYSIWIGETGDLATQCVKDNSLQLSITNDSTYPWVTREGFIQSTNFTDEGSISKISTTIDIDKTSVVSFECRNVSYGCVTNIYVDGNFWSAYNKISNDYNPWQSFAVGLDPGSHTLEFENVITGETTPSMNTQIRNISIKNEWTEVAVTSPGQFVANLVEAIGELSVLDVKYLKITGSLNERDWEGISRLSGLVAVDLRGLDAKSLPNSAFSGKSNLNTVLLPETLEEIGSYAFYKTSLSSISLPESLKIIHSSAFSNTELAEIHIPANVETIEYEAFINCKSLTKIIFTDDSKLKYIGYRAFTYTGIIEFLMPESVEEIYNSGAYDYSPFYGCQALRHIKLTKSLKSINNCLLYNLNVETVEIPEGITSIGVSAFYRNKIESITLPESLKYIGDDAFRDTSLKSIKIPQNVTYIGGNAFSDCKNLTEVTLNSYSNDLYSTFDGCEAIKTITVPSVTPPAVSGDPFGSVDKDNVTVLVPEFSLVSYKVDPYWFLFRHIKASAEISTSDFWAIHGHLRLNSSSILNGTPSIEIEAGGILDVAENTPLPLNEVSYSNQEAVPAVFLNESDQVTATKLTAKFSVPSSGTWYFFSPVTDVNMADVTYPATESYVIRYYDGANRAATNRDAGNWVNMPANGTLKRGQGYIIQAAAAGTLYMPAATTQHSAFFGLDEAPMTLADYSSETAENAGWNFVGNPYPTFYDIYSMELSAPITVWTGSTYRAYSLEDDDFVLRPMQPFFVQKTAADITLGMPRGGRLGTSVITRSAAPRVNEIDANRHKLNLEITSGENETADDYTRIVLNESASLSYEGKCDASKFMSMNTEVAQIYSLGDNRHPLAINERPYADGNAQLGIYIPKGGESYRISAVRADRKVWLYDAVSGTEQDLTEADYIFTADKAGNDDSRFSIRFAPATGTSVEGIDAAAVKVIGGKGVISVAAPADAEVAVYAADGSVVANAQGSIEKVAAAGVYVVTVNGQSFKTIVK